ncbi:MAG: RlmF-related methyltransferase [Oligoflexia bacterium]|nr:RlmF-related methyltransferase [Oligoflexia bacterium]
MHPRSKHNGRYDFKRLTASSPPPIPGRADALHAVADLLASGNGGEIPRGQSVRVLDIGVGANCVYPLIGQAEYGWSFVGSDADPVALESARSRRKWNNLGKAQPSWERTRLNFGGRGTELWCPGGEVAFIRRMAQESAEFPQVCRWFSTLVSKETNLPLIDEALERAGAREVHTLEMTQGQKRSRIIAWTFQNFRRTA